MGMLWNLASRSRGRINYAMMPGWLQLLLTIAVPLESVVVVYLLSQRTKLRDERQADAKRRTEVLGVTSLAELDKESKFVERLLKRVSELEQREDLRILESQANLARIMKLEAENSRLEARVELLKYELMGKISTVMNRAEKRVAARLGRSPTGKKPNGDKQPS